MGGFVGPDVEWVSAPAFVEAVIDVMRRAGVSVGAESLHEIGVSCNVVEPVETRGATLIVAVPDEMFRARLLISAESPDEVAVAGDIFKPVEGGRTAFIGAVFDVMIG